MLSMLFPSHFSAFILSHILWNLQEKHLIICLQQNWLEQIHAVMGILELLPNYLIRTTLLSRLEDKKSYFAAFFQRKINTESIAKIFLEN